MYARPPRLLRVACATDLRTSILPRIFTSATFALASPLLRTCLHTFRSPTFGGPAWLSIHLRNCSCLVHLRDAPSSEPLLPSWLRGVPPLESSLAFRASPPLLPSHRLRMGPSLSAPSKPRLHHAGTFGPSLAPPSDLQPRHLRSFGSSLPPAAFRASPMSALGLPSAHLRGLLLCPLRDHLRSTYLEPLRDHLRAIFGTSTRATFGPSSGRPSSLMVLSFGPASFGATFGPACL